MTKFQISAEHIERNVGQLPLYNQITLVELHVVQLLVVCVSLCGWLLTEEWNPAGSSQSLVHFTCLTRVTSRENELQHLSSPAQTPNFLSLIQDTEVWITNTQSSLSHPPPAALILPLCFSFTQRETLTLPLFFEKPKTTSQAAGCNWVWSETGGI